MQILLDTWFIPWSQSCGSEFVIFTALKNDTEKSNNEHLFRNNVPPRCKLFISELLSTEIIAPKHGYIHHLVYIYIYFFFSFWWTDPLMVIILLCYCFSAAYNQKLSKNISVTLRNTLIISVERLNSVKSNVCGTLCFQISTFAVLLPQIEVDLGLAKCDTWPGSDLSVSHPAVPWGVSTIYINITEALCPSSGVETSPSHDQSSSKIWFCMSVWRTKRKSGGVRRTLPSF